MKYHLHHPYPIPIGSLLSVLLLIGLLSTSTAFANLSLSQKPLFLGSQVTPNVFFMLDDSGSMDWEVLVGKHWQFYCYDPFKDGYFVDPDGPATRYRQTDNARENLICVDGPLGSLPSGTYQANSYRVIGDGLMQSLVRANNSAGGAGTFAPIYYIFGIGPGNNNTTNDSVYTHSCSTSDRASIEHCRNSAEPAGSLNGMPGSAPLDKDWRMLSSDLNVMYYNARLEYLPWFGPCLNNGSSCTDSDFTDARSDPRQDKRGYTVKRNLGDAFGSGQGFWYEVWDDDKGFSGDYGPGRGSNMNATTTPNGVIDLWDSHYRIVIRNSGGEIQRVTYAPYKCDSTGTNATQRCTGNSPTAPGAATNDGLNATTTTVASLSEGVCYTQLVDPRDPNPLLPSGKNCRTLAEARQNIANWYTYYRRRSLTLKAAVSRVLEGEAFFRYGASVINRTSTSGILNGDNLWIDLPPRNPPTGYTKLEDYYPDHNKMLLSMLFRFNFPGMGTPLQKGLQEAAKDYLTPTTYTTPSPPYPSVPGGINRDPITHECQQNFTILMTDGYWNAAFSGIGNRDGDGVSDTVADVAKHYYDMDLRTSMPDNVPTNAFDDNKRQHMVTYTVAFGVIGHLSDLDGDGWPDQINPFELNCASNPAGCISVEKNPKWGVPSTASGNPANTDDLWHAAYNARGAFLSARDPDQLGKAMADALAKIGERVASSSSVAVDAGAFQIGTGFYQARFIGGKWIGELMAFEVDALGKLDLDAPKWRAEAKLKQARDSNPNFWNTRTVITFNGGGVPFRWGSLSPGQQALLNKVPYSLLGESDTKGAKRLEYLRGSGELEGSGVNQFRKRDTGILGDIVHGSPTYVGAPDKNYEDSSYTSFKEANKTRTPMVYVGANDGMLHGFTASLDPATGGQEKLAYVPNLVFNNLNELTSKDYRHRYYVDGPPTTGDVQINGQWRTVLVGGLQGGGRGLYALDVTDPATFSESNATQLVLWEFTDPDMGHVYSRPILFKLDNKWVVLVGNGYNSTNHKAFLFIIDMATGALLKKVQAGTEGSSANPNGLAAPALVDSNKDGKVDRMYAGDLLGNMWRFEVPTIGGAKVAFNNRPLFTAYVGTNKTDLTKRQPITSQPEVGLHCEYLQDYLVYFGTGKYFEDPFDNQSANQNTQSFYAVWDRYKTDPAGGFQVFNRDRLLRQYIIQESAASGATYRVTTDKSAYWFTGLPNELPPTANAKNFDIPPTVAGPKFDDESEKFRHLGWFIDLIDPITGSNRGERQITNSSLLGRDIFFTTMLVSENPCDFGGTGWLMTLRACSGSRQNESNFDVNNDKNFDDKDNFTLTIDGKTISVPAVGKSITGIPTQQTILIGSGGDLVILGTTAPPYLEQQGLNISPSGRKSWRLLLE